MLVPHNLTSMSYTEVIDYVNAEQSGQVFVYKVSIYNERKYYVTFARVTINDNTPPSVFVYCIVNHDVYDLLSLQLGLVPERFYPRLTINPENIEATPIAVEEMLTGEIRIGTETYDSPDTLVIVKWYALQTDGSRLAGSFPKRISDLRVGDILIGKGTVSGIFLRPNTEITDVDDNAGTIPTIKMPSVESFDKAVKDDLEFLYIKLFKLLKHVVTPENNERVRVRFAMEFGSISAEVINIDPSDSTTTHTINIPYSVDNPLDLTVAKLVHYLEEELHKNASILRMKQHD